MSRMSEATISVKILKPFLSSDQLEVMGNGCRGDERDFFYEKINEYADLVSSMPKSYEQDGKGDDAIVYLHYFFSGYDWFITEKDREDDQFQAFGFADLGYGGELGYISINELTTAGVELDLHWTPKTLREVKEGRSHVRN